MFKESKERHNHCARELNDEIDDRAPEESDGLQVVPSLIPSLCRWCRQVLIRAFHNKSWNVVRQYSRTVERAHQSRGEDSKALSILGPIVLGINRGDFVKESPKEPPESCNVASNHSSPSFRTRLNNVVFVMPPPNTLPRIALGSKNKIPEVRELEDRRLDHDEGRMCAT